MTCEGIFLRSQGDIVGFARFVMDCDSGEPRKILHGHRLEDFAKGSESLVAIYDVRIFVEFEDLPYPYCFKSLDGVPHCLGDLNSGKTMFKAVVAWDLKKSIASSFPFPTLTEDTQTYSVVIIDPIRHLIPRSKTRVHFQNNLGQEQMCNDVGTALSTSEPSIDLIDLTADSEDDDYTAVPTYRDRLENRIEESVDQFDLDMEAVEEKARRNDGDDNKDETHRFEESVDQFDLEMQAEEDSRRKNRDEDSEEKHGEEVDEVISVAKGADNHNQEFDSISRDTKKTKLSIQCLSPAERIMLRISKNKKNQARGSRSRGKEAKSSSSTMTVSFQNTVTTGRRDSGQFEDVDETTENFSVSHNQFGTSLHGSSSTGSGLDNDSNDCSGAFMDDNLELSSAGEMQVSESVGHRVFNVLPCIRKREYRFKNRRCAPLNRMSIRRKTATDLASRSLEVNPFTTTQFCCKSGCYSFVNAEFAASQYRRFLKMDRAERKRSLRFMYNRETNSFWFDGRPVCSRFMVTLSFSNQLQSSVKGTPKANASPSIMACPRELKKNTKKDQIMLFLKSVGGRIGDVLPNKEQVNLPLLSKKQVFERFLKSGFLCPGEEQVSFSYFCDVWKRRCPEFKTHRHHGFAVCSICEQLRSSLANCENASLQAAIRAQMNEHYKLMERERRGYAERSNLAKEFPGKYISLIVDGADQKGYGLPHFVFNTKEDKGHKIKVKCIGVLEHGLRKHLSLFKMTEEFESGANHILEAIHRVMQKKKETCGTLPEILLVQADNCTRENKNKYFMGYCEMLVAAGVFVQVQVSFLPVGHTHADIDQAFSSVAARLRMFDALTMEDLIQELQNVYQPRATAEIMDKVANFSGLCDAAGSLRKICGISQYRFFRFSRAKNSEYPRDATSFIPFATTCDVKVQLQDEWAPLDNSSKRKGFLTSFPSLEDTPSTDTTPPENVLEVNKHLQSVEERIGSQMKMESLMLLKEKVYTRREESFHWDLETCLELNGDHKDTKEPDSGHNGSAAVSDGFSKPEDLSYPPNAFLVVRTEADCDDTFWIARTLRVSKKDREGAALQLKVRWYQAKKGARDSFSARYQMATFMKYSQQQFFDDTIDVRSVICQFESLTQSGGLHIRTQKAIRQCPNLN